MKELKTYLDIDPGDVSEDRKLWMLVEVATQWIFELLNRPDLSYQLRTEVYSGTGTNKLLLRHRPVYTTPAPLVYWDENAFYGSASGAWDPTTTALVYGVDFCLQTDPGGTTSRSGILLRLNDFWVKPMARQAGLLSPFVTEDTGSFKVIYQAGWTVDTLPAAFRLACNILVARLLYLFPLGQPLVSDSYEDRSVSIGQQKSNMLSGIKEILWTHRNFRW